MQSPDLAVPRGLLHNPVLGNREGPRLLAEWAGSGLDGALGVIESTCLQQWMAEEQPLLFKDPSHKHLCLTCLILEQVPWISFLLLVASIQQDTFCEPLQAVPQPAMFLIIIFPRITPFCSESSLPLFLFLSFFHSAIAEISVLKALVLSICTCNSKCTVRFVGHSIVSPALSSYVTRYPVAVVFSSKYMQESIKILEKVMLTGNRLCTFPIKLHCMRVDVIISQLVRLNSVLSKDALQKRD